MGKRKKVMIWLNTMPAAVLIGAIIVFPILYTAYISLTNMNLFHWNDYEFIGMSNIIIPMKQVHIGQ